MDIPRPHAVFDCNVLFQAMARPHGPATQCLRLVEQNQATHFVSKAALKEFRKILAYPEIRERNPWISDSLINGFIVTLLFRAVLLRDVPHVLTFSRDPGDEPYLDLALAANADFLVTRDKDLLSLNDEHTLEAKQIRRRCPALRIVTPAQFLTEFAAL